MHKIISFLFLEGLWAWVCLSAWVRPCCQCT